ncbi:MAG: porin [Methylobacterium sp.]|nr:porin [Methylobacterium sp.]
MKLVKSLLLGSAAGLVAVAGASAADLGVKKPTAVEYVKTCPQYGAGFFVVPGTTSCLKIIGRVRADYILNTFGRNTATPAGVSGRSNDRTNFRARAYFGYDHRTATEYGLLRTYVRGFIGRDNAGAYAPVAEYAFIQFGGFTAGRITPVFEHGYANLYNGSNAFGGFSDISYINSLGYTFQFGGGFSATVAVDSANERVVGVGYTGTRTTNNPITNVVTGPDPRTFDTGAQGGARMPDIVASLDYSGAWGSVKLAGALHEVNSAALGDRSSLNSAGNIVIDSGNRTSQNKIGFAVTAATKINLPMISAGSNFWLNGTYADGAISYAGFGPTAVIGGVSNSFQDAMVVGTSLRLTRAWALAGGLEVFATPTIRAGLYGTYASIDRHGSANNVDTYSVWGQVAWLPVSGFQIGGEIGYVGARYGSAFATANAGRARDHWTGRLRFQRDF